MIWEYRDCPMCGVEMKVSNGSEDDPLYLLRCPTKTELPIRHTLKLQSEYALDSVSSHFEVEYMNHRPHYMVLRIFPFVINSYGDVFNIYRYDERVNQRFIVETLPFEIPWKDKEKIIQKLSTYTLFS